MNKCNNFSKIPIVLLHGLGEKPWQMYPLELYLNKVGGLQNTHRILYEVNNIPYVEALDKLDNQLENILNKDTDKLIVIGQSMGGVMANNLHTKGWTCLKIITIGSPLHGARLLNYLESKLPNWITKKLKKRAYDYLMDKSANQLRDLKPPCDYHNITMSLPFCSFDGCVFADEAKFKDDFDNHTHLPWAHHTTIFFNPRLWCCVLDKIKMK